MNNTEWKKQNLEYWLNGIRIVINKMNYDNMTDKQFNDAIYAISAAYEFLSRLESELKGGNGNVNLQNLGKDGKK